MKENGFFVVWGQGFIVVLGFRPPRGFFVGLGVGLGRLFGFLGVGLVLGLLTLGVLRGAGFLVVRGRFLRVTVFRVVVGLGLRVGFTATVVTFDAKVELLMAVVIKVANVVRGCGFVHPFFRKRGRFLFLFA